MGEKSEAATPKKLKDARKKGQVAKSQDFPSAFTFIVSISLIMMFARDIFTMLSEFMLFMFRLIGTDVDLTSQAYGLFAQASMVILEASLPVMGMVTIVGVLVNFLLIGPLFASEAMVPDIKRLNPVENLKNLFKFKTLFELLKSIFKISGAVILIWSVVKSSIPEIIATASFPLIGTVAVFNGFLMKVIVRVGIFFIVVATFDLIFQRRNFANQMKMEKFQVKQEYKDSEGDPHLKSKRRQTAQEIAYSEGPRGASRARTIITNPTHYAIAIGYDEEVSMDDGSEPTPWIITMGIDSVAEKIIEIGLEHKIPIMRNVELAHILYETGTIGEFIPKSTFYAVAEILRWVKELEQPGDEAIKELFT